MIEIRSHAPRRDHHSRSSSSTNLNMLALVSPMKMTMASRKTSRKSGTAKQT
jgi:hypothetical protein